MSANIAQFFKAPTSLQWWAYPKLLGAALLVLLLAAMSLGVAVHPLLVGVVLHLVLDFTLQSDWVAAEKAKRGKALFIHSVIAGGIPAGVMGLMSGSLERVLLAVVVGVASHYAIDYTKKFGLRRWQHAICADQVAHFAFLALGCA